MAQMGHYQHFLPQAVEDDPVRWLCILLAIGFGAPAFADCTFKKMADFPVKVAGTGAVISTIIDGRAADFELHSRSDIGTMTLAQANHPGYVNQIFPEELDVGRSMASTNREIIVPDIIIGRRRFKDVAFLLLPNDDEYAPDYYGSIGNNIIRLDDVEYDFHHDAVRTFTSSGCDGHNMAYWSAGKPYSIVQAHKAYDELKSNEFFVIINDKRFEAFVDTSQHVSYVTLSLAREIYPRAFPMTMFAQQPYEKTIGLLPTQSVQLGDEKIMHSFLPVKRGKSDAVMVLGCDFLLSHRLYVARTQNLIYFTYEGGPVFSSVPATLAAAPTK